MHGRTALFGAKAITAKANISNIFQIKIGKALIEIRRPWRGGLVFAIEDFMADEEAESFLKDLADEDITDVGASRSRCQWGIG